MKRILIIGNRETGRNENYYVAVEATGAEPVPCGFDTPEDSVRQCDALLIPGGTDINPSLYGQANTDSRNIDDTLDAVELAALAEAVRLAKPVLGICRGLQILNVFLKGTLTQNIPTHRLHERENETDKAHATTVSPNSFLHDIYRTERLVVNSAHHQAIDRLGSGLAVVQLSDDGIIEAVQHESLPILAVQWHPERMCLKNARSDTADGLPLFKHFLTRC